jgi:hypothetical protein
MFSATASIYKSQFLGDFGRRLRKIDAKSVVKDNIKTFKKEAKGKP